MDKGRLEAFSDGVLAVIITIMVLDLRAPHGTSLSALYPVVPGLILYALSFVFVGIYWNNHHHLLHTAHHIDGRIMWLNLHLLFWLSLVPFVMQWMGNSPLSAWPAALYGIILLFSALAYFLLQNAIVSDPTQGCELAKALGNDYKGKMSPVIYIIAIGCAFINPIIAYALYIVVAVMWFVPDSRIERRAVELHRSEH